MAEQTPQSKQEPEKESSTGKTPISASRGVKRKQLFGSADEGEKKSAKPAPRRKKTISQPGSPTLLGTPGRTIPLSERQQLALLMQMTASEESPQGQTPPQKPLLTKPNSAGKNKINNQNNRGETSLHLAAIKGDVHLAQHLLSQGADVNAQDYAGWTALHEASNHGFFDLANVLLKAGAQVNALGSEDFTPLHDAAVNGHKDVVQILLKHGANPLLQNRQGQSSLDLACSDEIRKLMQSETIQSASGESNTELQGPTSLQSGDLERNPAKKPKTEELEDPYDFNQENSNGQKITIHWAAPDKAGKNSYMEITRKIPKFREPSTPVSFTSSSTSDSDLLDPQLNPILTKTLTPFSKEESSINEPSSSSSRSNTASGLTEITPASDILTPTLHHLNFEEERPLCISEELNIPDKNDQPLPAGVSIKDVVDVSALELQTNKLQTVQIKNPDEKTTPSLGVSLDSQKVAYTIPRSINKGVTEGGGAEETNLRLTIRCLGQDSDLVCATPEKKTPEKKPDVPKKSEAIRKVEPPKRAESPIKVEVVEKLEPCKKSDSSKKAEVSKKDLSKKSEQPKKGDSVKKGDVAKKGEVEKKSDTTKKSEIIQPTLMLLDQCSLQSTVTKRLASCDSLSQFEEKNSRNRQSPSSQIRLQVVSDHSNSSDSDSIREWRILPVPSLSGDSVSMEETSPSRSFADVGAVSDAGDATTVGESMDALSSSLPAVEQTTEKQLQVKDKTKKHKDKSQKAHKRHKHSHSHAHPAPKEEQQEPLVESSSVIVPPVIPPVEVKRNSPVPSKKLEEEEGKDGGGPAARAYYIVQQKQPSSSGEIKKLLLRTSDKIPLHTKQVSGMDEVTSSNEIKSDSGKNSEPDSTAVADEQGIPLGGSLEQDGGSSEGNPLISSSDEAGQSSFIEGKVVKSEIKVEKPSDSLTAEKNSETATSEDKPQKITRTLRSNSNLQTVSLYGNDNGEKDKEKESASQPMTRSRRYQLEAAASGSGTFMSLSDQSMESHPRKRKMARHRQQQQQEGGPTPAPPPSVPIHEQVNSMEAFMNIRREMKKRQRAMLIPITPNMPPAYNEYLMHRKTYLLQSDPESKINRAVPKLSPPENMNAVLKVHFESQEKQRHSLRLQHQIEREKLMLATEQDVLRVYSRGARAVANQAVPFSACMILKDEEVYNIPDPLPPEDSKANNRQRFNGRQFYSWLHDVDEKYEKIKEDLLKRHQQEAASLYAIQKFEWELKLQELKMWDFKSPPKVSCSHVPMVEVDRDFDLLPA